MVKGIVKCLHDQQINLRIDNDFLEIFKQCLFKDRVELNVVHEYLNLDFQSLNEPKY